MWVRVRKGFSGVCSSVATTDPAPTVAGNPPLRVELRDVCLRIEDRVVFDQFSLSLDVWRTGFVGGNGAGKSQLLRLIAGLTKPDSGTIRVNGFDPAANRRRATSEIGFVFQNPDHALLFPTVIEELTFGPQSRGTPRADARAMAQAQLQAFGVAGWAERLVHSLSQGQKHLLGLMAASIGNPRLLLLDEAFAGLDLVTTLSLQRILANLPTAQIEASHDLIGLAHCDNVLWIEAGKVKQEGAPETVLPAYRAEMEARAQAAPDWQ